MTFVALAWRGLCHHRRMFFSVLGGVALAVMVMTGALLVGDSIRESLMRMATERLGAVQVAMPILTRHCGMELPERLQKESGLPIVSVLRVPGRITYEGGEESAVPVNRVQVLGVASDFRQLMEKPTGIYEIPPGEAVLNVRLASSLGVKVGEEVTLQMAKPGLLPGDAPLSSRKDRAVTRAVLVVRGIASDSELGRFGLEANQVPPFNCFVNREWLQERIGASGRINLCLSPGSKAAGPVVVGPLNDALRRVWQPRDVGVAVDDVPEAGVVQVQSERVYLEPAVADAMLSIPEMEAVGTLTYLVNRLSVADDSGRATPYSFVEACTPSANPALSPVPAGMQDHEIVINQWLAEQLTLKVGDQVVVAYYELNAGGGFTERERSFVVRSIVEMDKLAGERLLAPRFPGLSDVGSCRDWDVGIPMDEALLKDKANEAYWERYRATPKAFVTLAAGQAMWRNRFGSLTSVRYAGTNGVADRVRQALRERVDPASLGLGFVPVREQALRAVEESENFGGLFLGMSFFLIVAAFMLAALLFAFGVEHRAGEVGALLAVGMQGKHVRRVFLTEGALVALAGSIVGAGLAAVYTRGLVYALGTEWRGAVAGGAISYHAEMATFLYGIAAGAVAGVAALVATIWRISKRPARELLEMDLTQWRQAGGRGRRSALWTWGLTIAPTVVALAIVVLGRSGASEDRAMAFFGAGALLLVAGLSALAWTLRRIDSVRRERMTLATLGLRNAARRPGRSVMVAGLLASGTFIIVTVSAVQQDVGASADKRHAGTGGFSLLAESAIPVAEDLNTTDGRMRHFSNPGRWPSGVEVVSMRVRDGDDASCFNLNRAQTPRLIGVPAERLAELGAFAQDGGDAPWALLDSEQPDGIIPGLAGDMNTAQWGLKRKIGVKDGDVLSYRNERGEPFRVRLVGALPMPVSVLQGSVIVSEAAFNEQFPSAGGYSLLLVDVKQGVDAKAVDDARDILTRTGFDIVTTVQRLRDLHSVESAYLAMFVVLGGLGLVLGSVGLWVMVLRTAYERRRETGMLICLGYTRREIGRMVRTEHWVMVVWGLVTGMVAAAVGVWPGLSASTVHLPYGTIAVVLTALLAIGLIGTGVAVRVALRGDLAGALRTE